MPHVEPITAPPHERDMKRSSVDGGGGGRWRVDESVGSCVTCVDTSTFNVSPMDRALTIR